MTVKRWVAEGTALVVVGVFGFYLLLVSYRLFAMPYSWLLGCGYLACIFAAFFYPDWASKRSRTFVYSMFLTSLLLLYSVAQNYYIYRILQTWSLPIWGATPEQQDLIRDHFIRCFDANGRRIVVQKDSQELCVTR